MRAVCTSSLYTHEISERDGERERDRARAREKEREREKGGGGVWGGWGERDRTRTHTHMSFQIFELLMLPVSNVRMANGKL